MSLSQAGTSLYDLFADSLSRIQDRRWSEDGVDPIKDVNAFAQQLVKVLSNDEAVAISLTTTTPYDLFRTQLAHLRDRAWDQSPGGLHEFSEALVNLFASGVPIGIDATSTSLYALFKAGIARLRQRQWNSDVQPFADAVVRVLSSDVAIPVTA